MIRFIIGLLLVAPAISCASHFNSRSDVHPIYAVEQSLPQTVSTPTAPSNVPIDSPTPVAYSGRTIDEVFGVITDYDFQNPELRRKTFTVSAGGFEVVISKMAPVAIKRRDRTLLKFQTNHAGHYWSGLVGTAHLLGPKSTQVYVVATGPGAVCCTNYWIADVTDGHPREIFRSEIHGDFREPMEIFDADGDGVYELVQFDTCFRYFRDDCGSCSPEPRAYFKYDRLRKQYLPATGIQENFTKVSFAKTKNLIIEKYGEIKREHDAGKELDLRGIVLDYVADLFHIGKASEAWRVFNKFDGDRKDRDEIVSRLKSCKFYNELQRSKGQINIRPTHR